jgi:hypothetical protein
MHEETEEGRKEKWKAEYRKKAERESIEESSKRGHGIDRESGIDWLENRALTLWTERIFHI